MQNLKFKETNCILIHPEFSENSSLNYKDVCKIVGARYPIPPLGLITVAALLPQTWNFKLIDLNTKPLSDKYFEWADIVCTGGMLSQQRGIIEVIKKAHQYGKKVVIGGPDPTCQPEIYSEADYLVIGEGETTIPLLLKDLENGVTKGVYSFAGKADMSGAVIPRYDLIRFSDYLMVGMQYSRGCPYNCEFCNVIELFGRNVRAKTISHVINELQFLFELGYRGHVFFIDDNFPASGKSAEELLQTVADWSETKRYPFFFSAESSLNFVCSDKLLQLMRNAGFRYISIGIETPEDDLLKSAQKQQNMYKSIPEIVRKMLSFGIIVDASFILGFDDETEKTANYIIHCIQDSGICMAMVGTLFALPNTQLSARLKMEGRLIEESTNISDSSTEIDQMSSGLNFQTIRERTNILHDYIKILSYIYDPVNYFNRLKYVGLHLIPNSGYTHNVFQKLKLTRAFGRVCIKLGFRRNTWLLYWKLLLVIFLKNPGALESVASFAAMYMHLYRHSRFIINLTHEKIKRIERYRGMTFNH
jgi:radical SAM superfamily enzyme YgiQ (UPF0313 family)